jgi:diguanylate cyclase (GGDEF)-like protein/PAS domain S-box-containing protein
MISTRPLITNKNTADYCKEQLITELENLCFLLLIHEATVRSTSAGQFEWDYEHNRLGYCSKEYASIFGQSIREIEKAHESWDKFFSHVHPDDRDRYLNTCGQRHTQSNVICEYRIILDSGETRYIRETNIYVQPNAKVIRGNFGIIRDVSLEKRVENFFDNDDTTIVQLPEFNDLGCFLYDEINERYLYVNEALANIYGVEKSYLLEHILSENDDFKFVYKDDREAVSKAYHDAEMGDIWEIEYRMIQPDGEILWVREIGKSYLINNDIEEQTIGVVMDISDRKEPEIALVKAKENLKHKVAERTRELDKTIRLLESEVEERKKIAVELQHLANHDPLTGLPSIRLGMDRLSHALAIADRAQEACAVMFLDIDGFKSINDNHGHQYGDEVLKIIAGRFQTIVRDADTVSRIGGDEFLVVLSGIPETKIIERIATNLVEEGSRTVNIMRNKFHVGLSIGIALYPGDGTDADELIKTADKAMYQVKKHGGNHFRFAES